MRRRNLPEVRRCSGGSLVTNGEIRAMLARCDPKQLRVEAGISTLTVCRALSIPRGHLYSWETLRQIPQTHAGYRWARFTAGLERHAAVTAEMAATEKRAA